MAWFSSAYDHCWSYVRNFSDDAKGMNVRTHEEDDGVGHGEIQTNRTHFREDKDPVSSTRLETFDDLRALIVAH